MRIEDYGVIVKSKLPFKIREFKRGDKVYTSELIYTNKDTYLPENTLVEVLKVRFHPNVLSDYEFDYESYPRKSSLENRGHTQLVTIKINRYKTLTVSGYLLKHTIYE